MKSISSFSKWFPITVARFGPYHRASSDGVQKISSVTIQPLLRRGKSKCNRDVHRLHEVALYSNPFNTSALGK